MDFRLDLSQMPIAITAREMVATDATTPKKRGDPMLNPDVEGS